MNSFLYIYPNKNILGNIDIQFFEMDSLCETVGIKIDVKAIKNRIVAQYTRTSIPSRLTRRNVWQWISSFPKSDICGK